MKSEELVHFEIFRVDSDRVGWEEVCWAGGPFGGAGDFGECGGEGEGRWRLLGLRSVGRGVGWCGGGFGGCGRVGGRG